MCDDFVSMCSYETNEQNVADVLMNDRLRWFEHLKDDWVSACKNGGEL